jgi:RNA polymerase sigma-70 factor (ECF subfamily)
VNKEAAARMTDRDLLGRFYEKRDNAWLGALLERYTLLLLGVCLKYLKNEEEAKDSVQQIFLKVIQELSKYRVEYFKSWIYTVARNHCLMKLRDRQGKIPAEITEKTAIIAPETDLSQNYRDRDRLLELMSRALVSLNPEQHQCVTLFYLEKKSYQDIADLTGFTLMQVKSHIQNGKRNLRILIDKQSG